MIKEISDATLWNSFATSCEPNTFLHAWEWGQVQKAMDEEVRYVGVYEATEIKLRGVALIITVNARRGRHYLIPHGPLVAAGENYEEILAELVAHLREHASTDTVAALRIAPLVETSFEAEQLFAQHGFRPAPLHMHAERTWLLDITKSAEELLAGMRKTTRHAIAKAKKAGVTCEVVTNPMEALERFWPLYEETRGRHGFVLWPKSSLAAQLELFGASNEIFSVVARYEGQDVAAAILPHFGGTVFYYHGASAKLPSSVPAAQLLQWTAIQEAKRRGAGRYNFWGIAPANEPKHPFAGITTFKTGFGGYEKDYLHAQDLPLNFGYWTLWAVDTFRKLRRGF
jgi:lipid II:glycine glycyltransferase (peptidoglycan interpeptide bridge formation enzyme)